MENRPVKPRSNNHNTTWGDEVRYYNEMENQNSKYDHWTTSSHNYQAFQNGGDHRAEDARQDDARRMHRAQEAREGEHLRQVDNDREYQRKEKIAQDNDSERHDLGVALQAQMDELVVRDGVAKKLRVTEAESMAHRIDAANLRDQWVKEEKRRAEKDIVLFNMNQHRRKLEEKGRQVREELRRDQEFVDQIKRADLLEHIGDENKKHELKATMEKFDRLITDLQALEERRKPDLEYTFDSEAKPIYEQFSKAWNKEKMMRESLIKEVLDGIQDQIDYNVVNNKARQMDLVKEKEELLQKVHSYREEMSRLEGSEQSQQEEFEDDFQVVKTDETYDEEVSRLKDEAQEKRVAYRRELDEQIKENRVQKNRIERLEREKSDVDNRRAPQYGEEMPNYKNKEQEKRDAYRKELDEQIKDNRMRKDNMQRMEREKSDADLKMFQNDEIKMQQELNRVKSADYQTDYGRKKMNF